MTAAFKVALVLLIIPIQMQWAGALSIGGIRPDLPAAAIYGMGLVWGPWTGGIAGLIVGLLADRFSGGFVGPQLIAKLCIGVAGGLVTHRLLLTKPSIHAAIFLLLGLLQGFWITMMLWWRAGGAWSELYRTALPEACYTALIVLCGLGLVRLVWRPGDRTARLTLPIDR